MTTDKIFILCVCMGLFLSQGCGKEEPVSFKNSIVPILAKNCVICHSIQGEGYVSSGLNMESYETLMKGTKFGSVINPGDSIGSTLVALLEGRANPNLKMPHGDRKPVSEKDILTLRKWIDQGAQDN